MDPKNVAVDFDERTGVLYVREQGARFAHSAEFDSDDFLILNHDREGRVVGIQVISASDFASEWVGHPVRDLIPPPIRERADSWMRTHAVNA